MIIDLVKVKLLRGLEAEAEKTVRFIEFLEITEVDFFDTRIDRAVIRYYALLRRIEVLRQKAAQH
jgi:hypothetical protein